VFCDVPVFEKLDEPGIFESAELWILQRRLFRAD
jgi:hypothetical protein